MRGRSEVLSDIRHQAESLDVFDRCFRFTQRRWAVVADVWIVEILILVTATFISTLLTTRLKWLIVTNLKAYVVFVRNEGNGVRGYIVTACYSKRQTRKSLWLRDVYISGAVIPPMTTNGLLVNCCHRITSW